MGMQGLPTSLAMLFVGLVLGFASTPVEGRQCMESDIFPTKDYSVATIPAGCTLLNLDDSNIGDTGATAIAAALKTNTEVTTLELDSNNIGARGATALANCLKVNTGLTTLWLEGNTIGDAGATAIAAALTVNTALTTLDLFYNDIGDAGASAFIVSLSINTALIELNLDNTNTIVDTAITRTVEDSVAANKKAAEAEDAAKGEAADLDGKKEKDVTLEGSLASNKKSPDAGDAAVEEPADSKCEEDEDAGQDGETLQPLPSPYSSTPSLSFPPQIKTAPPLGTSGTLSKFVTLQACRADRSAVLLDSGSCDQMHVDAEAFAHIASSELCAAAAAAAEVSYNAFKEIDDRTAPRGCFFVADEVALYWNRNSGTEHTKASRTSLCCEQDEPDEAKVQICPKHSKVALLGSGSCDQSDKFAHVAHIQWPYLCQAAAVMHDIEDFKVVDNVQSPTGCSYSPEKGTLFWNTNPGTEQSSGALISLCCESTAVDAPAAASNEASEDSGVAFQAPEVYEEEQDDEQEEQQQEQEADINTEEEGSKPLENGELFNDAPAAAVAAALAEGEMNAPATEAEEPAAEVSEEAQTVCGNKAAVVLLDVGSCDQSADTHIFSHIASLDVCEHAAVESGVGYETFAVVDKIAMPPGCFFDEKEATLYWNKNGGTEHTKDLHTSLCCEQETQDTTTLCPAHGRLVLLDSGTCNQSTESANMKHLESLDLCKAVAAQHNIEAFEVVGMVDSALHPTGCFYAPDEGTLYWNGNAGTESSNTGSVGNLCCETEDFCPEEHSAVVLDIGSCDQSDDFESFAHVVEVDRCEGTASAAGVLYEAFEVVDESTRPTGCFFVEQEATLFWNNNDGTEDSTGATTSVCCKHTVPEVAPIQICPMYSRTVLLVAGSCDQSDSFDSFSHIQSSSLCEAVAVDNGIEVFKRISRADAPNGCSYSEEKGALFWNKNYGVEQSSGPLTNVCCESAVNGPVISITSTLMSNHSAPQSLSASMAASFTTSLASAFGTSAWPPAEVDYCVVNWSMPGVDSESCFDAEEEWETVTGRVEMPPRDGNGRLMEDWEGVTE